MLLSSFAFAIFSVLVGYQLAIYLRRRADEMDRDPAHPSSKEGIARVTFERWHFGASVLAGGLGGSFFALGLAPIISLPLFGASVDPSSFLGSALVAPFAEETGKGLLVLALFFFGRVRTTLDGLILGIGAGVGFAAFENMIYFLLVYAESGEDAWWAVVQMRLLLAPTLHGCCTGLFGAYLGAASASDVRRISRLSAPFAALFGAITIHALWNGGLAVVEVGGPVASVLVGFFALGFGIASLVWTATRALHNRPLPPLEGRTSHATRSR